MDPLTPAPRPAHLLCISGHDEGAFRRRAASVAEAVAGRAEAELASFCFGNDARQPHHALRAAVVGSTAAELAEAVRRAVPKAAGRDPGEPRLALMFTGQGSQYPGMARDLYRCEPEFRRHFDEVAAWFESELGAPLQDLVLRGGADAAALARTELTQPAVFAVDYAVGRLLLRWGVRPEYVLGHSVGEFAAACIADALDLAAAARIVRERGRLMQDLPARGGMVAVFASIDEVERLLASFRDRLFVGAYNGAHQVVSGEVDALDELVGQLAARGVAHRRLEVSQAFHTPLLRPMLEPFRRAIHGIVPRPPRIPIVSNVTGAVTTEPLGVDHWLRHVLEPVRFEQGIRCALDRGVRIFVEAGPDKILASLSRGVLGTDAAAIPVLQRKGGDVANALRAAGALYERGVNVDLEAVHAGGASPARPTPHRFSRVSLGRPVALPSRDASSPFGRASAAAPPIPASPGAPAQPSLLWKWAWKQSPGRARVPLGPGRVVVIGPEPVRSHLEQALGRAGVDWTLAVPGSGAGFGGAQDLAALLRAAAGDGALAGVIYLLGAWSGFDGGDPAWPDGAEEGAHTLASLAQALEAVRSPFRPRLPLVVATRGAIAVGDGERGTRPWQSPALALAQVLGIEEPWIDARALDVEPGADDAALIASALDELAIPPDGERLAARRVGVRLERELVVAPGACASEPLRIEDGDTFLVSGGASGVGAEVALGLARRARVNLVLVGRRRLPSRDTWDSPSLAPADAERVAAVRALERAGARVRYEAVDVADAAAVAGVVRRARDGFGPIRGVVHCAGVVDGEALRLADKTAERLRDVLRPKVRGTVALDEATREEPLEFFVAFSSVAASSVRWAKGLADYGAANAYLDQFCHARAARGARGRSIAMNWSLWRGKGMGRELGINLVSRRNGLAPLEPERALASFFEVLQRTDPVVHVLEQLEASEGEAERSDPRPPVAVEASGARPPAGGDEYFRAVAEVVAEQVGVAAADVDPRRTFRDLGLDSHGAIVALRKLEARIGRRLYPTLLFEHKTPEELAAHLATACPAPTDASPANGAPLVLPAADDRAAATGPGLEMSAEAALPPPTAAGPARSTGGEADPRDVAIVGMACRLPGADDPEAFWELLLSGRSVIGEAPPERFPAETYFERDATSPHLSYSKWGGFIAEPYAFDAMFFGISPREAVSMDPQQRIFLEVAWHAIQRAGYVRERPRDVGVFVGSESNSYAEHFINYQRFEVIRRALARHRWWAGLPATTAADILQTLERELAPAEITSDVAAGNGLNEIAARVSHFLDLHGPSLVMNSACSSSLTAVHYACDSIRRGEVSMAIAGGVSLNIGTTSSVVLSRVKALSPTGECRPFDRRANGMVLGEGAAALVLKPLARARADGDHVHAVIKGSFVNNDGRSSGITVPTAAGQAEAVRRAYEVSRVDPNTVGYVECHGTATPLGDPIEVQGLALSIGANRDPSNPCLLGSVKGSIGHMLGAAGIPSMMKVALALEHGVLPPTAGYEEPSPHIDFGGAFVIASGAPRAWPSRGPRRAGVNAFGFGGTNCHVILEECAPAPRPAPDPTDAELLVLYGRTPAALREVASRLARALARRPDLDLPTICRSMLRSQRPLAHLAALVVRDRAELAKSLDALLAGRDAEGVYLGHVNARLTTKVVAVLGTEWLPGGDDAAALAAGSPRLEALAESLSAGPTPSGASARLQPLHACVRLLAELGLPCDAVIGDGDAAPIAARLRAEFGLPDRTSASPEGSVGVARDPLTGRSEPVAVLGLGVSPAAAAKLGVGPRDVILATPPARGSARRWGIDLLARVAARGAPLRIARTSGEPVRHVPLCEYPLERTRYVAFEPAATRAAAGSSPVAAGRPRAENSARRTP